MNSYPAVILLLPLVCAAAILFGLKRSANISALVSTGSALATFLFSLMVLSGKEWGVQTLLDWSEVAGLRLGIDLKIDALSSGMMIVVTGIGSLVHLFSLAYMKDDAGKARYFAGLSLFMFSMTGIVYAANFAMMFIFWELVGVSSYILIGHWYQKNSAAEAAKKAFLTNRIGDFGFMIGILMLWSLTGGLLDFDSLKAWFGTEANVAAVAPATLTAATLLVFCGTVGKSAQFPLHVWLPDAMEGPTPVSALIHAATMVAAGVYMLVRVSFLIAASASAGCVIAWIGGITALMAALMATQQNDIKRILAYSTLSQLGYMVMAAGLGASEASMFHLFTHAWFKAGLFLGSGAIIFACHHEQNIWKMGGLKHKMPVTFATFAICTAALIAVPFTSGWWSKEAILDAAWEHNKLLFGMAAFTALLTAFYMTRLCVVTFFGKARDEHGAGHAHEVPQLMRTPLVILATLAVIGGFGLVAGSVLGEEYDKFSHLHLGVPALVSICTLVAGAGFAWKLYIGRDTDPINIRLFANKFYFDEIYKKIVGICQDAVAMVARVFDSLFIDALGVGGAKSAASSAGNALRRIQSGNLQAYAFLFGLGALVILFLALAK